MVIIKDWCHAEMWSVTVADPGGGSPRGPDPPSKKSYERVASQKPQRQMCYERSQATRSLKHENKK